MNFEQAQVYLQQINLKTLCQLGRNGLKFWIHGPRFPPKAGLGLAHFTTSAKANQADPEGVKPLIAPYEAVRNELRNAGY